MPDNLDFFTVSLAIVALTGPGGAAIESPRNMPNASEYAASIVLSVQTPDCNGYHATMPTTDKCSFLGKSPGP